MGKKIEEWDKIGDRLRKIREWRHISPSILATKIESSVSYISRMENGEVVPALQRLYAIAKELRVSITDILVTPTIECDIFKEGTAKDKNILFQGKLKDYEYKLLLGKRTLSPNIIFHPYLIRHKPSTNPLFHQHHGWEMVILKKGKIKIVFRKKTVPDKREEYLENPFDVAIFNSDIWHAYIPLPEGAEAETISIISDTAITNPTVGKNVEIREFDNGIS